MPREATGEFRPPPQINEGEAALRELENGVLHEELPTAEEFLNALNPMSSRWGSNPSAWIYRGHGDAGWALVPKALRDRAQFVGLGIKGDPIDWTQRRAMIVQLLDEFVRRLDRAGIEIPVEIVSIRDASATISYGVDPPRSAFPAMALAQHHGLPTLLLDWSRRPRVAAYFAAQHAADPAVGCGSHIAVWALRAIEGDDGYDSWSHPLMLYNAAAATNPNLRAQAGLFTFLRDTSNSGEENVGAMPLDEYVEMTAASTPGVVPGRLALRRLTLTREEAPRLLRLLANEGIDGASMFPGPDGVVRAMREVALWDAPAGEMQ